MVGKTISHYRILEKLGGGGMGVVYKAEDTQLGRPVALKFLPEELAQDRKFIERFHREARAASALDHPNICTVHEIGEHDGIPFLVMQCLEGQTLKQRLSGAPAAGTAALRTDEILDLGIQIADGLEAAHAKGIIHRDIKPANIFVTARGQAKILDFGLAKLAGSGIRGSGFGKEAETAAAAEALTSTGMAVGTVEYMSPEQVRAEELDARTDLFSFGLVLYEMATGRRAFAGDSVAMTFDAILNRTPVSALRLNPQLPVELETVLSKALEKDRALRYQTAADLKADLQRLKRDSDSGRAAAVAPVYDRRTHRVALQKRIALAAIVVIVAAAVLAYWLSRPPPPPRVLSSVQITNDGRAKSAPIFTDGSRLYFGALAGSFNSPHQVSVAGGQPAPIPVPITSPYTLASLTGISADGSELLLQSIQGSTGEGPLWVIPTVAGSGYRLSGVTSSDAAWSPDGQRIVYCRGNTLNLAKRDGSESRQLTTVPGPPGWIRFSPDGHTLRFTVYDPKTNSNSLWEAASDGANPHPLLPGWNDSPNECCGNWTPDGKYYVFQSTRNSHTDIWAIREKTPRFGNRKRDPMRLTSGPLDLWGVTPGKDGKRLFAIGSQPRGELVRYDAKSGEFVPYLGGIPADTVDFSRDGKWMTYVAHPEGTLWRSKLDGSERLQLTFPPMTAYLPRWSPDAKQIAFQGAMSGKPWVMYLVSAEGGNPEQIATGLGDVGWTADGKSLVYSELPLLVQAGGPGKVAIHLMDLKTRQVSTLPDSEGLYSPRPSPDGRYIAAIRSGPEVLLVFDLAARKWVELTTLRVGYPSWSHDSKYVYFDTWEGDALCRVRVSDRKLERLGSLKGLRRTGGPIGAWSGLAPDDSPLVLRDTGTQEIYALDWEAP